MVDDRELWAVALAVIRQNPDDAHIFTAERLGALAASGDAEGVRVWPEVAKRINAMVFEGAEPPN